MRPFEGVRVLDLTRVLAGPYCSYLLGLLGADVIKVEPPGGGETIRRRPGGDPALAEAGLSIAWATQSANKRCITLDLDHPDGQEAFRRLAARADVVVQNLRTGSADRRGIGYPRLRELNPRLVWCAITAYGANGPRARDLAYDSVVQAVSGLMALTGTAESGPLKAGPPVVDYATGLNAALAVVCALYRRERSGEGCAVDVAMLDANYALMMSALTAFLNTGREAAPPGNDAASRAPVSTTYRAADGLFAIAVNEEHQYRNLFAATGLAHLNDDPRYNHPAGRAEHKAHLRDQLQRVFETDTAEHWERVLNEAGVPGGRVRSLAETTAHPQFAARALYQRVRVEAGAACAEMDLPLAPFVLDGSRGAIRTPPRPVGADTDAVLREAGYDDAALAALRARGVI